MATRFTTLIVGDATGLSLGLSTAVPDLPTALERLSGEQFDVVVLDLHAHTSDSVSSIRAHAPAAVIIALAEMTSASQVMDFVRKGADDAVRFPADTFELEHAVLIALERRAALEEGALLTRFVARAPTNATAQLFGSRTLRQHDPDAFEELTRQYGSILDLAVQEQVFRDTHAVPERLRALAQNLSMHRAGPRDLIELHTATLGFKLRQGEIGRVQGYVEEGKLLLLELMGDLVAIYRHYAAAFWPKARTLL